MNGAISVFMIQLAQYIKFCLINVSLQYVRRDKPESLPTTLAIDVKSSKFEFTILFPDSMHHMGGLGTSYSHFQWKSTLLVHFVRACCVDFASSCSWISLPAVRLRV